MSNAKTVSILDAELRAQDARTAAKLEDLTRFFAEELARLRARVDKLEAGVTPAASG